MSDSHIADAPLGRNVVYPDAYDPTLLFPISREPNRESLIRPGPWYGSDIWNAYEVSWLNQRGLPRVALARFSVPADSPNLIESKSFKLYLNSFNEVRYDSAAQLREIMEEDLSRVAGAKVGVVLEDDFENLAIQCGPLEGELLDNMDVAIEQYQPNPTLLRKADTKDIVTESLVSNLLKSNCPVTGQPDWGSIQVRYTGPRIDRASLLQYIVSFRRHTEFHEHCVERMYCDIWHALQPESLFVMANYTRRGGLDINPWRSSHPTEVLEVRTPRQ